MKSLLSGARARAAVRTAAMTTAAVTTAAVSNTGRKS